LATPRQALGEGIDLIVMAPGKREQFSGKLFEPSGTLWKTNWHLLQARYRQTRAGDCVEQGRSEAAIQCLRTALRVAPDYADAIFNLALLLLQRKNDYAEAADYWRRYLGNECQSEWAVRARRSLKFCEMQIHSLK
jgi:tetratricopeptide (TPR) repeat protein